MIKTGLEVDLIAAIVISVIGYYCAKLSEQGKVPGVKRHIAALEGVKEGVGVCAELGKSLHYGTGPGEMTTRAGTELVAAMAILDYTARLAARSDVPVYVSIFDPSSYAYVFQILRQAYGAEGKLDILPVDAVRYYGAADTSYNYGIVRTLRYENAGANYAIGAWDASTSINCEAAYALGLFQVGGAALHFKGALPFFVATCEYTFICEEMFAAGAMLTEDKGMLGTLYTIDLVRYMLIAIMLLGIVSTTFGSTFLADFLVG